MLERYQRHAEPATAASCAGWHGGNNLSACADRHRLAAGANIVDRVSILPQVHRLAAPRGNHAVAHICITGLQGQCRVMRWHVLLMASITTAVAALTSLALCLRDCPGSQFPACCIDESSSCTSVDVWCGLRRPTRWSARQKAYLIGLLHRQLVNPTQARLGALSACRTSQGCFCKL